MPTNCHRKIRIKTRPGASFGGPVETGRWAQVRGEGGSVPAPLHCHTCLLPVPLSLSGHCLVTHCLVTHCRMNDLEPLRRQPATAFRGNPQAGERRPTLRTLFVWPGSLSLAENQGPRGARQSQLLLSLTIMQTAAPGATTCFLCFLLWLGPGLVTRPSMTTAALGRGPGLVATCPLA